MIAGIYLHPWDLFDDGAKVTFDNIVDRAGLNSVTIAATYHGGPPFRGGFFLQHNLKRRFYIPEAGVVYFNPHPEYYRGTRLKPIKSRQLGDYDALDVALKEAKERNVQVFAWIICLRNERLAAENPECAIENIFGVRDPTWLCPNNPNSKEYLLALIEDIVSNYDVSGLELESLNFGSLLPHPRGLAADNLTDALLKMCFCDNCRRAAKNMGYDWETMERDAKEVMRVYMNMEPRVADSITRGRVNTISFIQMVVQMKGLEDFMRFQADTLIQVLSEMRERIGRLGREGSVSMYCDFLLLRRLRELVNYYIVNPTTPEQLIYQASMIRLMVPEAKLQLNINMLPGTRNFSLEMIETARKAHVRFINFYNYGNMHTKDFDEIKVALACAKE
ncbi:MAG: hypothetical protein QW502_03385 [Candidatus Bathyarchaeia archaeon]